MAKSENGKLMSHSQCSIWENPLSVGVRLREVRRSVRGLDRVFMSTEMLLKEKIPSQV